MAVYKNLNSILNMNTTTTNLSRIRFQHPLPDGGMLTFTAPIVGSTLASRGYLVRIPSKVRGIPFPPFDGRKIVAINPAALRAGSIVSNA